MRGSPRVPSFIAGVFGLALLAGCVPATAPKPPSPGVFAYKHKSRDFEPTQLKPLETRSIRDGVWKVVASEPAALAPAYTRVSFVLSGGGEGLDEDDDFWVIAPNYDDTIGFARSKKVNVSRGGFGAILDLLEREQVETIRQAFKPHVAKTEVRRARHGALVVELPATLGPGRYIVTDRRRYFAIELQGEYSRWRERLGETYLRKRRLSASVHLGGAWFRNQTFRNNVGAFIPATLQLRMALYQPLTFDFGLQIALLNAKAADKLVSTSLFTATTVDLLWFTQHLGLNAGLGAKLHSVGFMRTDSRLTDDFLNIGSLFMRAEFVIPFRSMGISVLYDRSLAATRGAQWHEFGIGFEWHMFK